jgi:sucrose-6-phosphate hydrolase SacC (GH32 family)
MERQFTIWEKYLYFPIQPGKDEKKVEVFAVENELREKIMEFMVPIDKEAKDVYPYQFQAEVPMKDYIGKTIVVQANVQECFFDAIENAEKKMPVKVSRPAIHFAVDTGWTNDPNGMTYHDGYYHLYFQYNPFNTGWNNMSWGHAVSQDLLHWKQFDTVMFPDQDGTMYSGCGIANTQEKLGLPKEAMLFYYTVAGGESEWSKGKQFTQKIAYSLDDGATVNKLKEPCLDTIYHENRDPKVFWHEESKAYIMVLWLRWCEYAIFRSEDMEHWECTQTLQFEDTWECPDLFQLKSEDGGTCWFFWTADGFYFPGHFDGYEFHSYGERHSAYIGKLPYAAQTFSGIHDRVISIPWLRMKNDGRPFTGAYGIPTEFTFRKEENGHFLIQKPVQELYDQMRPAPKTRFIDNENRIVYYKNNCDYALLVKMHLNPDHEDLYRIKINGSWIEYMPVSGTIKIDKELFMAGCDLTEVIILIDDKILEVFFDGGRRAGTFALEESGIYFEMNKGTADSVEFFEIV